MRISDWSSDVCSSDLGRYCILTPPPGTDAAAVERTVAFWRRCGSLVELMDARHHDRVLAITSHVPHLLAYTIVGTASDLENQLRLETARNGDLEATAEVIQYSAGRERQSVR